jgi:hypothetical protein
MLEKTAMKRFGSHGMTIAATVIDWSFIAKQSKRNLKK